MPPKSWFTITNKDPDTLEIDLFDEIGLWGVSAKDFIGQLRLASSVAKNLTLNIDSPGGACDDGFTMLDGLNACGCTITANITGVAASMASVVMLAAKKINIAENGRVMIHRVSGGAMGNPDDLDAAAKRCRQYEDRIVSLYVARTGKSEGRIRDLMKADQGTWLFGQDAVDAGFADAVMKGTKAKAFNLGWARHFTMLPAALFDTSTNPEPTPPHPTRTMTDAEIKAAADKKAAEDKAAAEAKAKADKEAAEAKAKADKEAAEAKAKADKEAAEAKDKEINDLKSRLAGLETIAQAAKDKEAADLKAKADAEAKANDPAELRKRLEALETAAKAGVFGATQAGPVIKDAGDGRQAENVKAKALEKLNARNKVLA